MTLMRACHVNRVSLRHEKNIFLVDRTLSYTSNRQTLLREASKHAQKARFGRGPVGSARELSGSTVGSNIY